MNPLRVSPDVRDALAAGRPVVALESTVIAHGLPRPHNLEIARELEAIVRREGTFPATVAVMGGALRVGLDEAALVRLAQSDGVRKVSVRDLAPTLASGEIGATTVAATLFAAYHAGIRVFATGGIGGVHRGNRNDVSADLPALANTPMVVVCAGAKAVLDLAATLEWLETHGVPVLGYGTGELPAFFSRASGLCVDRRVDSPAEVARIARAQWALGLPQALLVCVPVAPEAEVPSADAEAAIGRALRQAQHEGISGKEITPFLLRAVTESTGGASLRANLALLRQNARVAAEIAAALASPD